MERRHEDDVRKLWVKIAVLTVLVAVLTGNQNLLGWMLEVMGI